jgi:hypothetical protein
MSNMIGPDNTATGSQALLNNTNGASNTATGAGTLFFNTIGNQNTANGVSALLDNTTGNGNTATGVDALLANTTGNSNTANGAVALGRNTTGGNNTASGVNALSGNVSGGNNTAEGFQALLHSTGSNNIGFGSNAGSTLTTGSNNIDIGNKGFAGEAAKIRIGTVGTQTATFIAGIHGVTVASALQVVVDVNGHLGTVGSSKRFKEAIKPMDKASEAILSLKPVTFRYKKELDPDSIPQFGLVAEDVEKVNPDLVVRGQDGKPYTVRYEAVNAMLLNEFLKEHRTVEEQQRTIIELKAAVAKQQKQVEALTTGLQKVTARVESNQNALLVVSDN